MEIKQIKLSEIKPYSKNAKLHDERQIKNVAESIRQFGWQQPIVLDKDKIIIIGHCRFSAAQLLKLDSVPCVIADNLSDEDVKKLRLLDNKTNESEWDYQLLLDETKELDFNNFDIEWGLEDFETDQETETFEDDFETNLTEKKLLKCPVCGHINEEKAFKNIAKDINNEDTD